MRKFRLTSTSLVFGIIGKMLILSVSVKKYYEKNRSKKMLDMGTMTATCKECSRVFDLFDDIDTSEWHDGHDCEA
jgi:hypothetical protein